MYKSHFPTSPDLPPPHDQPFPNTDSTGKGDKSHREPLHHSVILATRPQTPTQTHEGPSPYLRPNAHAEGAAVCHLVQVQLRPKSREGTRGKGGHPCLWPGRAGGHHGVGLHTVSQAVSVAAPGPGPTSQIFLTHCAHMAPPQCQGSLDKRVTN